MALVLGFSLGMNDGRDTIEIDNYWIANFFASFLSAIIICFAFVAIGKLAAGYYGYNAVHEWNPITLLFTITLAFITYGYLIFFVPGCLSIQMDKHRRLGKFRYGPNVMDKAMINLLAVLGMIAVAFLALPFRERILGGNLFYLSLLVAMYAMLPIPKSNAGLSVMHASPKFFIFSILFVFFLCIGLFMFNTFAGVLVSAIGGVVFYFYIVSTGKLDK
ncbi:MAG TPA: hypothetical protein ENN46_02975 [Candidatus Woesearchaeota archaeon]|nr:hypothetical protein [Candidatus Woesearchaeota archaeon]